MNVGKRLWTETEQQMLVDMFNKGIDIDTIARRLGRSYDAANSKACKLGLKGEFKTADKYISIDGTKLKELIYSHFSTYSQFAEALGVGASTVSHFVSDNYIPKFAMYYLKTEFGISEDDLKPDTTSQSKSVVSEVPQNFECKFPDKLEITMSQEQMDELIKRIGRVVYKAMHQALNEPSTNTYTTVNKPEKYEKKEDK